jgi:predicted nucleic acid-binding protein
VAIARYLADKSALSRLGKAEVGERLGPLIAEGAVAICGIVALEILYSACSAADYAQLKELLAGLERVPVGKQAFDRALEVQEQLAKRGEHRGASLPDLLLAAAAERAGLTILHYDSDFDRIAATTGQTAEWVVPRGTVG